MRRATGHAEGIEITFDPKVISFHDLLVIFFTTHDPTTLNRQGADAGTQYRSAIFTHSEEQKQVAEQVIKEIEAEKLYRDPIVTEVTPFTNFYPAEDYHQDYYANNPNQGYCQDRHRTEGHEVPQTFQRQLKRIGQGRELLLRGGSSTTRRARSCYPFPVTACLTAME